MKHKTMTEFWDDCHKKKLKASLSGSQYKETISFLKIEPFIQKGNRVLEVGVGFGYVTKELADAGLVVSTLDISEVALANVAPFCEATYDLNNLDKVPKNYFDCIICVNVVQHLATDTLEKELAIFIEALRENTGVLALQFVSTVPDVEDTGHDANLSTLANGSCCRTPEYMQRLIASFGGTSTLVVSKECDINMVKGNHVLHVSRLTPLIED